MAGSLILGPIGMLLGGVAGAALGFSANSEIVRRQREEIIWAAVREILRDEAPRIPAETKVSSHESRY
jgi:hypothetical protein